MDEDGHAIMEHLGSMLGNELRRLNTVLREPLRVLSNLLFDLLDVSGGKSSSTQLLLNH